MRQQKLHQDHADQCSYCDSRDIVYACSDRHRSYHDCHGCGKRIVVGEY